MRLRQMRLRQIRLGQIRLRQMYLEPRFGLIYSWSGGVEVKECGNKMAFTLAHAMPANDEV